MEKKNLILDLGGVLLNIDYEAPVREFTKLGIEDFDKQFSQSSQNNLFDAFDKGLIDPEEFRASIRELFGTNLSDTQIDYAWNSILLDMPSHRMNLLSNLSQSHNLYLLSNTNEIHIEVFEERMNEEFGENAFRNYFKRIYYSSRIHMRKPDEEIFRFVIEDNSLDPATTIFIDDSVQHIAGAKKCGINAYLLEKGRELQDLLSELKIY